MREPGRFVTAFLVTAGLGLTLWSVPAGAHSGGRAQLYVDSVHLAPHSGGRQATLVVRDADSGQPEPGFGVQLTASGPGGKTIGPVALTDPHADGHYAASVPLPDGPWSLTVQAAELPGGPRAIPFTKTWSVILQPGQPLDLAGSGAPAGGGGNSTHGAVPVALALLAVASLFGLTRTRRFRTRTAGSRPAPARPTSDLPSRT